MADTTALSFTLVCDLIIESKHIAWYRLVTNRLVEVFLCDIWCGLHSILLVTLGAKAPRVTNRIECNPNQMAHSKTPAKPYCHDSAATSHDRKEEARSLTKTLSTIPGVYYEIGLIK